MKSRLGFLARDADAFLWVILLVLCNAFFIFMAWLAYPETFCIIILLMLTFSICCVCIGLWRSALKKKKIEVAFHVFLSEPSVNHEDELVKVLDNSYAELIRKLGIYMRDQERFIGEEQKKALAYEEFIEAWVHEIKTPLSLATLVLDNRKDEMSELVHQRFEHIKYTISDHVDRILYYARMQSSHSDYCYNSVLLSDCCEAVLEELRALIEEKNAQLITKLGNVQVITDEKTLQFILAQIISNSLKYSNTDKKSIIRLEAGISEDGRKYYLEIADNGLGVPSADLPFIFDKGFTGNHTNRKKATGIGLFLVKHFCDEMQIEIQAESTYLEGLKIILQFPVVNN